MNILILSSVSSLNQQFCLLLHIKYQKKTVVHEIMHALGQVHEQQRKDRDQHIIMHWNNIIGGQNNKNMEILSIGSHDRTQYDPTSSLQYSLKVSHTFFQYP